MSLNAKQIFLNFRYINASVAVCLLFLVGSLAPQSFAAPAPLTMSKKQEDPMRANPCGYDAINTPKDYDPKFAQRVAVAANIALDDATSYKNEFAHKILGDEDLLMMFNSTFSRATNITLPQDKADQLKDVAQKDDRTGELFLTVPPKEKYYGTNVADLEQIMMTIEKVLPTMYKILNAVSKEMDSVSEDQDFFKNLNNTIIGEKNFQDKMKGTAEQIRAVLCYFDDLMRTKKFKDLTLNSEVESFMSSENRQPVKVAEFYLDTLNYLEYVEQVFNKMKDTEL